MRILLVNPPYDYSYGKMRNLIPSYPPIGLAYLMSALEGHDVELLDMALLKMNDESFKAYIRRGFDIIMFTSTTATINTVGRLCSVIKDYDKSVITVVGGSHATAIPERTLLEFKPIDIVVIGEGEETIKEVADSFQNGKRVYKVRGICIRKGSSIIRTRPRTLIKNLDSIKFPRIDSIRIKNYSYWLQRGDVFSPLLTSRGCPFRCTFCSRGCFGNVYRKRSIRNVIDEINSLVEYGVNEIHIIDDNFTMVRQNAIAILDEIIKSFPELNIAFINGVRADKVDRGLLIKMKKANTYYIGFGVESGDKLVLESTKKELTLGQIEKAVNLSKAVGIDIVACFFILGLPQENIASIQKTIEFARKIRPDILKFSTFVPYPGNELYKELKRSGRIKTEDWEKYTTYGPLVFTHPKLTDREFELMKKKAYINFIRMNNLSFFKTLIKYIERPKTIGKLIFDVIPGFIDYAIS